MILLSDMYGGSVNSIMYTFLNRPNTTLIAGVNLALVIGLVIQDRGAHTRGNRGCGAAEPGSDSDC